MEEADMDFVRRMADIMGPSSAAANALHELERRRAAGQDAVIYQARHSWIVGPRIDSTGTAAAASGGSLE